MKHAFSKWACLGLATALFGTPANAQNTASGQCLTTPDAANCSEPLVMSATNQQIKPAFPNPQPACQQVTNNCTFDLAVPVASQQEWTSFLQSQFLHTPGTCASVGDCPSNCQAGNWGIVSAVDRSGIPLVLSGCSWALPDGINGQTFAPDSQIPNAACQGYYPSDPGIGWFRETQTLRLLSVTCTPSGYQGYIEEISENCEAGGRVRRCEGYTYTYETQMLTKQ